jgi:hypothetical protein
VPPSPRTCDEIRADGTYLDEAERDFFLDSCLVPETSTAASTAARADTFAVTESERAYRVRAESIAYSYLTSLHRYSRDSVTTSAPALIEYGGIAGGWANQMGNFEPVPTRFQPAHYRLQIALGELSAHSRLIATGQDSLENPGYVDRLNRGIEAVNAAIASYFEALGLPVPHA